MNILLTCDSNVERAGVCLFILQWVRGIRATYKEAKIIVYFRKKVLDKKLELEFIELGSEVITGELPERETSLSKNNRDKVKRDIDAIMSKYSIDVVHVNSSAVGFSCMVLSVAKKHHVPVRISHSHGRNLGNGIKNIYLIFLKRLLKHLATKYAGCSVDAGVYLFGEKSVKSDKWYFVPNTIDVEKFSFDELAREQYRANLGISEDELVLGSTGQLIKRKNHAFLLDVLAELKKRRIKAKLIVLGEGDQRAFLEKKIVELNLKEDVLLLGESNEIYNWLSSMDIYAMPSLTEGLPIGAVEAQANGLYCILSNGVPPDVDLSEDVYHLKIEKENINEWVDLISNLPMKTNSQRLERALTVATAGFDSKSTPRYIRELYELK